MSRLSTVAVSTFVPALNVLSTTLPDSTFLSLVRTKAPPLPGLTCWNSTTDQSWPSRLSTRPFFRSLVVATDLPSVARDRRRARVCPAGEVGWDRPHIVPAGACPARPAGSVPAWTGPRTGRAGSGRRLARATCALCRRSRRRASPTRRTRSTRRATRGSRSSPPTSQAPCPTAEPAPLRLAVESSQGYLTPKLDVRAAVFDDARPGAARPRDARTGAGRCPAAGPTSARASPRVRYGRSARRAATSSSTSGCSASTTGSAGATRR